MAPYTITHLKLDMIMGGDGKKGLEVYLTNSLEDGHAEGETLFAQWLSRESERASEIKREYPVMVMMGNPPYSVSSNNKWEWIAGLLRDYKEGLGERNIQPLSDDYIKFIRLGQHYIERNGSGVLAYITNNSYLDGLIHRQMRKNLLGAFDEIYIANLHGNSKTKETTPEGGKDESVFDITVGTAVAVFVKRGVKTSYADSAAVETEHAPSLQGCRVHYLDLWGRREENTRH